MDKMKALMFRLSSLENCIKVQMDDFPGITRSEAEKMGKLLHQCLTCDDDSERERKMEKYKGLRDEQAKIGQNRPEIH